MRGADALLAPLRAALQASGLGEADLWVHRRRAAITRYSHSSIHQNAVPDETQVHARAIVGSALGDHGGRGYADDLSHRATELDPAGITARAIEKCALDRDRVQLAPGDYEAVFEEDAVAEVLRIMSITGLSGQSVREGRSFMTGAIGQAVTGGRFTLYDDALHPGQLAIPFDPEG